MELRLVSQQADHQATGVQAEFLRQRANVAHEQEKVNKSMPQFVKKPNSMKQEQLEAPFVKETSRIAVPKDAYEKPKTDVNTEAGQELGVLVAENHFKEAGQVEPGELSLIMQELPGTETDDAELATAQELLTESQIGVELIETEDLSTDPFQIDYDDFEVTQAGEAEGSELDSLLATVPFLEFDRPVHSGEGVGAAETLARPALSKQLAEHIQTFEPAQAEEATAILDVVLEKIQKFQEPVETGGVIDDPEVVQQELEALCVRLLACMDVEPTPKRVNYLLQTLMSEVKEQVSSAVKSTNDQGTHERKQDYGSLLTDWRTWMDDSLSRVMGECAVKLTAPETLAVI